MMAALLTRVYFGLQYDEKTAKDLHKWRLLCLYDDQEYLYSETAPYAYFRHFMVPSKVEALDSVAVCIYSRNGKQTIKLSKLH